MKRMIFTGIAVACLMAVPRASKAEADWPRETIGGPTLAEQIADIVVKAQKVAAAKEAANAEIEDARRQFFADCVNGIRGGVSEKNFAELLFEKDIYFLSLYMQEGMTPKALRQLKGIDILTGGELDGGLPPVEIFGVWVNAVRTALGAPPPGQLWLPTPAEFIEGIAQTSDVYEKYKVSRDRAEFGRWRKSIRITVPAATTADQLADNYIKYILNPALDKAISEIPEGERASVLSKVDVWRDQMHHAILDLENVEVTPEKVAEELRFYKIDEDFIKFFIDSVDRARQSGEKDLPGIILRTQQEVFARQEQRNTQLRPRSGRALSGLDWTNRTWVYTHEAGKLNAAQLAAMDFPNASLMDYLYGPGQPIKFPRDTYHLARDYLQQGRIFTEPEEVKRCR
jgi:hypothetical protein